MLHLKWMHILNIKFVLKIINCHIIIDISQNVFDHELFRPISPHSSLTPWLTTWWAPLQTVMLGKNSRGFTSYPNYNCIFLYLPPSFVSQLIWLGTHLTPPPLNPNISSLFLHVSSKWIRESRADAGLQSSSLIATCKTICSRTKRWSPKDFRFVKEV